MTTQGEAGSPSDGEPTPGERGEPTHRSAAETRRRRGDAQRGRTRGRQTRTQPRRADTHTADPKRWTTQEERGTNNRRRGDATDPNATNVTGQETPRVDAARAAASKRTRRHEESAEGGAPPDAREQPTRLRRTSRREDDALRVARTRDRRCGRGPAPDGTRPTDCPVGNQPDPPANRRSISRPLRNDREERSSGGEITPRPNWASEHRTPGQPAPGHQQRTPKRNH